MSLHTPLDFCAGVSNVHGSVPVTVREAKAVPIAGPLISLVDSTLKYATDFSGRRMILDSATCEQ